MSCQNAFCWTPGDHSLCFQCFALRPCGFPFAVPQYVHCSSRKKDERQRLLSEWKAGQQDGEWGKEFQANQCEGHTYFRQRLVVPKGVLILRRLLLAIWGIIMQQGGIVPFVNCTFEWGVVIATFLSVLSTVPLHCACLTSFLHPTLRRINAVPITLTPRRRRHCQHSQWAAHVRPLKRMNIWSLYPSAVDMVPHNTRASQLWS